MLLSGISISVVIPPAAAARVAVEKPSHSVRLVDVNVCVDDSRHHDKVVGLVYDGALR
jgi:hypothetical protein